MVISELRTVWLVSVILSLFQLLITAISSQRISLTGTTSFHFPKYTHSMVFPLICVQTDITTDFYLEVPPVSSAGKRLVSGL